MRFPDRPAARLAAVESFDTHAALRQGLRQVAAEQERWAGIPMPLEGERLIVEPSYPGAQGLMAIGQAANEPDDGIKIRNAFWSMRWRCEVVVLQMPDGKIRHSLIPGANSLFFALHTLGCSVAWGVEQESNALQLLGTMLSHHAFKTYLLTGTFLEKSQRSGLTYLFRRLRPTVAIREHKGAMKIMCALCQHPIALYADSWAGAMCPTDDVVAVLAMMRGDEKMLWRRSNQHPAWAPQAGI